MFITILKDFKAVTLIVTSLFACLWRATKDYFFILQNKKIKGAVRPKRTNGPNTLMWTKEGH